MDSELSEIAQALENYLHVANSFNKLIAEQSAVPQELVKKCAYWAMMFLLKYRLPGNWTDDGKPRIPIPVTLAKDIAENIQRILQGHIPKWMLHLQKIGAPQTDPRGAEHIGLAVVYKRLAADGKIKDRRSTKTIAEAYGVTSKTVQNWMKEYSYAEPTDFFPAAAGDEARAMAIAKQLPKSGDQYRQWGRSPRNPRPFGKAQRRPSAKS
jgi:hypothetical protein